MSDVLIVRADARRIPLPDDSVQCVVTSPPYWGLRKYEGEQDLVWDEKPLPDQPDPQKMCDHDWADETERVEIRTGAGLEKLGKNYAGGGEKYSRLAEPFTVTRGTCRRCGAWRGGYGLEPSIEMYVQHSIEILREIRRVLRPDGVVFWNIGDSYASGAYSVRTRETEEIGTERRLPRNWFADANKIKRNGNAQSSGCKPKDLCLMPERIALAAQADGWWVRSRIVWDKRNPMPESVEDRPTDAWEHIWLFTKSERYYWDWFAVREASAEPDRRRNDQFGGNKYTIVNHSPGGMSEGHSTRHMRNIWSFATQPFSGAHFATFPEELPRRAIIAGTSQKGACLQCGAPWKRISEKSVSYESGSGKAAEKNRIPSGWHQSGSGRWKPEHVDEFPVGKMAGGTQSREDHDIRMGPVIEAKTIGWSPTCLCRGQHGKTKPCLVLDPFGGSGTTGRVAVELNRQAVLLDISYGTVPPGAKDADGRDRVDYATLAAKRTKHVQRRIPL